MIIIEQYGDYIIYYVIDLVFCGFSSFSLSDEIIILLESHNSLYTERGGIDLMDLSQITSITENNGPKVDITASDDQHFDDMADHQNDDQTEDTVDECVSETDIIQKHTSKSIRGLHSFFSTNMIITEKGNQKTNLINVLSKKTYCLPPELTEEFFSLYENCRTDRCQLHYSERQQTDDQPVSGIMIDFDRYQDTVDRQLLPNVLIRFTRALTQILENSLVMPESGTFHCFVIMKPAVAQVQGHAHPYKDGAHILIPEIMVSVAYKKWLIRQLVDKSNEIFRGLSGGASLNETIDKMSAAVPVYFLGSCKPGVIEPYPLAHIFRVTSDYGDINVTPLDVEQTLAGPHPYDPYSCDLPIIAGKSASSIILEGINWSYELSIARAMEHFRGMPTWLRKRTLQYKPSFEGIINTQSEKLAEGILNDMELRRDEEEISLININNPNAKYLNDLLSIVDIKRAESYNEWFKVICAVAHSGRSAVYKAVARNFSRRRPADWSEMEFDRVWDEACVGKADRPVTIGSIKHWARESAPAAYAEIDREHHETILRRSALENEGRIEHATVARLCKAMCNGKFVVDCGLNPKTGRPGYCWFEFVTPGQAMSYGEVYKWRIEYEPDNVHLFIADHLPKVYTQVREYIKHKKDEAGDDPIAKYWVSVEKGFKQSQRNLGNDGFQNGVVRQARFRFRQRGFMESMDADPMIIGVGNGVLELGRNPRLIRGYHEYRISKFTSVDYIPFDIHDKCVQILLKAFADIFPEQDVFDFMMFHASTGLTAQQSACLFLMCVAGGCNGKSFYVKMIHNTVGNQYCAAGKPAILVSPAEKAGDANSAMMQMKGKRAFYVEEFTKSEILNTGRMKSIVTPGWQSGRDIYEKQCNFIPTSNIIAMSNFPLLVELTDHGTWRRIYFYKNKVKFCTEPDPNNPYEKLIDRRYVDVYPDSPVFQSAMMSIMVEWGRRLEEEYGGDLQNVPVPTIVRETAEFRNSQDFLNRWLTTYLFTSPGSPDIPMTELASTYIGWVVSVGRSRPTIDDVCGQLENSAIAKFIWRESKNRVYLRGFRIKAEPEEIGAPGEEDFGATPDMPEMHAGSSAEFVEAILRGEKPTDWIERFTGREYTTHPKFTPARDDVQDTLDNLEKMAPVVTQSTGIDDTNNTGEELMALLGDLIAC